MILQVSVVRILLIVGAVATWQLFQISTDASEPAENGKIAYVSTSDGQIWLAEPNGLNATPITDDALIKTHLEWAPDGRRLLFTGCLASECRIYALDSDGTDEIPISEGPRDVGATWSPQGDAIAFFKVLNSCGPCDPTADVLVFDPSDGSTTSVNPIPVKPTTDLTWSPAGDSLAYGQDFGDHFPIWVSRVDGSGTTEIDTGLLVPVAMDWSPIDNMIVLAAVNNGEDQCDPNNGFDQKREIYRLDTDVVQFTQLTCSTFSSGSPQWSPNGDRIAYIRSEGFDGGQIYSMAADGTDQDQLGGGPGDFHWSPDGSGIVYHTAGFADPDAVWTMAADGSGNTLVAEDAWEPTWQPVQAPMGDRAIVFIQGIDSESRPDLDCPGSAKGFIEDGQSRTQWMTERVPPLLQQGGLDVQGDSDFYYVSYAGVYCDAERHQKPTYNRNDTCDGVAILSERLDSVIRSALETYEKVDIVGHSMGGMVAAYWLWSPSGGRNLHERVNSVITFDSPLRGVPDKKPDFLSECSTATDLSWNDLWCQDYDPPTNEDCASSFVRNVNTALLSDVPFFTIDATQNSDPWGGPGIEAVPGDRTTLLDVDSRLHCKFDNNHDTVWTEASTGVDPVECWTNMRWPPSAGNRPKLRISDSDAKAEFVACAILSISPSQCVLRIGEPLEPSASLSESVAPGSNILGVTTNAGFQIGNSILINPGMPNVETRTIVGFGSLVLDPPLEFAHEQGEPIFIASGTEELQVFGDTDCDGDVTAMDALEILKDVGGLPTGAQCLAIAGNVDCDSGRTALDALAVLRHVVDLPLDPFPGCPAIGEKFRHSSSPRG